MVSRTAVQFSFRGLFGQGGKPVLARSRGKVLDADIALLDIWQDVRDRDEITVDMQHDEAMVNGGSAYQKIDGTRTAVLSLLGELVLRVVHPAPAVLGYRGSTA